MSSWRDAILKEFVPAASRLTLVADPDSLLTEEGVLRGIRRQGFELIPFEDPIAFRFAYESQYRGKWDAGEATELVVVLRSPSNSLRNLPYDLLNAGRQLSFNLAGLFPRLSCSVVSALDRGDLDSLWQAQEDYGSDEMGVNTTKDFILLHVFDISASLIRTPADLLKMLARRHFRGQRLPRILDERIISILKENEGFADWPLDTIVPDRTGFLTFVQERWPVFVDCLNRDLGDRTQEPASEYGFTLPGPADLPFDHHDVRVYVESMFTAGLLKPLEGKNLPSSAPQWLRRGVLETAQAEVDRRLDELLELAERSMPKEDARFGDWLGFAPLWARGTAAFHDVPVAQASAKYLEMQAKVDMAFREWLAGKYAGLHNLPPCPPVMLHHVPRFLAQEVGDGGKAALVVVDGLAMSQWVALRHELEAQIPGLRVDEQAIFAWVPTLTTFSRQALLAGVPPLYFPNSVKTTSREPALWKRFWMDRGLSIAEVGYEKNLGDPSSLSTVERLLDDNQLRIVALVVDKVDRIAHGMEMGSRGMLGQVRLWGKDGFLASVIRLLIERGFAVHLTSDHGNVEGRGCGKPAEGAVAETHGSRARIYSDAGLRRQISSQFPTSIEWPSIGLPDGVYSLLAGERRAFIGEDESVVSHGGASIEEVIVPFVSLGGATS